MRSPLAHGLCSLHVASATHNLEGKTSESEKYLRPKRGCEEHEVEKRKRDLCIGTTYNREGLESLFAGAIWPSLSPNDFTQFRDRSYEL